MHDASASSWHFVFPYQWQMGTDIVSTCVAKQWRRVVVVCAHTSWTSHAPGLFPSWKESTYLHSVEWCIYQEDTRWPSSSVAGSTNAVLLRSASSSSSSSAPQFCIKQRPGRLGRAGIQMAKRISKLPRRAGADYRDLDTLFSSSFVLITKTCLSHRFVLERPQFVFPLLLYSNCMY